MVGEAPCQSYEGVLTSLSQDVGLAWDDECVSLEYGVPSREADNDNDRSHGVIDLKTTLLGVIFDEHADPAVRTRQAKLLLIMVEVASTHDILEEVVHIRVEE